MTTAQRRTEEHPYPTGQADFARLAALSPALRRCLRDTPGNAKHAQTFDPSLAGATETLLRAMMLHDFGLNWLGVPPGYLLPSVIRSVNYLFFVRSLVDATLGVDAALGETVHGVDIGTGASAIFPILGCALNPTWQFTATEVDETALEWAQRNVDSCALRNRVVLAVAAPGPPSLRNVVTRDVAFVMCNPPFFIEADPRDDRPFQGREGERAYDGGGEVEFVRALFDDSRELERASASRRWYTSMLGIKASSVPLLDHVERGGASAYGVVPLIQGAKRRWVLAWAFAPLMPVGALLPAGEPSARVSVDNLQPGETIEARASESLLGLLLQGNRSAVAPPGQPQLVQEGTLRGSHDGAAGGNAAAWQLTIGIDCSSATANGAAASDPPLSDQAASYPIRIYTQDLLGMAAHQHATQDVRQLTQDMQRSNRQWRRKIARML